MDMWNILKGEDIVDGDVVILEAGDVVTADMRFIRSKHRKIEESALTGESVPVDKDLVIPTGDEVGVGTVQICKRSSSTNVTYDRAVGVVTSTLVWIQKLVKYQYVSEHWRR